MVGKYCAELFAFEKCIEGGFRFYAVKRCAQLSDASIAFRSKDCTAIIHKVLYNVSIDDFIGFSLPLDRERLISFVERVQTNV